MSAPTVRERARQWRRARHVRNEVRALVAPPPERFAAFGRSLIVSPARVESPQHISIGDGVLVHEHVWFSVVPFFSDVTPHVSIGDRTVIGRCCQFSVVGGLHVEADVLIGDFVQIGDTFHPYEADDRMTALMRPHPVTIGRGAVIGGHAIVLPGVTVGAGAYVEHHAVVNTDVAPGAIVAGRPAQPRTRGAS